MLIHMLLLADTLALCWPNLAAVIASPLDTMQPPARLPYMTSSIIPAKQFMKHKIGALLCTKVPQFMNQKRVFLLLLLMEGTIHETWIHYPYPLQYKELTPYQAKQGKWAHISLYGQKNNIINELSHLHLAILAMHNKIGLTKKMPILANLHQAYIQRRHLFDTCWLADTFHSKIQKKKKAPEEKKKAILSIYRTPTNYTWLSLMFHSPTWCFLPDISSLLCVMDNIQSLLYRVFPSCTGIRCCCECYFHTISKQFPCVGRASASGGSRWGVHRLAVGKSAKQVIQID
jgi:hypothetical protein